MNQLRALLANKHTSGAAFAYAALVAIDAIAKAWFPNRSAQIEETTKHLRDLCFVWMGFGAADSGQLGQIKKDVQDIKTGTDQFTKPTEPPKGI